ncbi:MAG: helix-turn-helix domain-containing protein [Candidatus Omnitrophica bacterium]|nr:helix-turn-helix domain-containing protein [Candidatus Omnitrophota bacterium]
MEPNLFTATEAAHELGISKEVMARYCRQKRLVSCVRKGRIWLIPASSLKAFQQIQRKYKSGRPRKYPDGLFWRESHSPHAAQAVHILATRAPTWIPRLIPKSKTRTYIASAKTKLERIVRKTLINELYESY